MILSFIKIHSRQILKEHYLKRLKYNNTTVPNTDNKINKLVTVFANRSRNFIGELTIG